MSNSLLIAIVTEDVSEKALDIAQREGIKGSTALPATGISQDVPKTFFGLTFQAPMKVLFWITPTDTANRTAEVLNDELNLASPKQGIALTLPIDRLFGLKV